ncbi:fungal pheromone STE3G-protein-coupled receptor [Sistotremastrum niveocremeum HHB9708]|uniref:Fungal pheromone STE3G-protein-coupled receptor n=1 Tax=Sistotremastrum niveocremeum HHB9708 TaxID=1314777 RepID=A0A164V4C6_9AGAM|nr:fungal pheromone STE3G-protein-coupled receptor [Sistotremastrum niveocremeum HHB9708]
MRPLTAVYVPVALFCSIIVLIPLPWHLSSWNGGTCLIMIYACIGLVIRSVDRIVWDDNTDDSMKLWCDITSRLTIMVGVGLPASAFCLSRRLYIMISNPQASMTGSQRQLSLYMDLAIGVGLPCLVMGPIGYGIQVSRYDIAEGFGCFPSMAGGRMGLLLVHSWSFLLGFGILIYGVLLLRSILNYSQDRSETPLPARSGTVELNPDLTKGRFERLVLLSLIQSIGTLGPSIWISYYDNLEWKGTHEINRSIPAFLSFPSGTQLFHDEFRDWLLVMVAVLFFGFFGFAEEARYNYRKFFRRIAKAMGVTFESPRLEHDLPPIEFATRYQDAWDLETRHSESTAS